jgi:hypothetical protein
MNWRAIACKTGWYLTITHQHSENQQKLTADSPVIGPYHRKDAKRAKGWLCVFRVFAVMDSQNEKVGKGW